MGQLGDKIESMNRFQVYDATCIRVNEGEKETGRAYGDLPS